MDIPDDPMVRSLMESMAKRPCCDRCAEYQRKRRDLVELLQKVAIQLQFERDPDVRGSMTKAVRSLCERIVSNGESHYRLSGLSQHVGDFVESVISNPGGATVQAGVFERGLAQMAQK